ncbi:Rsm1-like [Rhizoctonia solani]|uniref:Rsm1-like n=1 Tax=Rhizoctonia solani TaxID=456999 RepID=A0A8H7IAT8_9AGAM|nr:Rsm1-like [Rhizoctonia solani]
MQSVSSSGIQSDLTATTIATTGASTSSLFPSSRITKRKLQDALDALDDATSPSDSGVRRRGEGDGRPALSNGQTPQFTLHWRNTAFTWDGNLGTSKPRSSALSRLFRNRSLKRQSLSQSQSPASQPTTDGTPGRPSISHPFALAPNTNLANKLTSSSAQFTFTVPTPVTSPIPVPIYRPASVSDFLERLSTFKLSTYRDKPAAIDAVAAARCGWRNEGGKDRLTCNVCGAAWIVGNATGMTREAASALIARHVTSLVQNHKNSCPWRLRQCDPSIYRLPLKGSSALIRDIGKRATSLPYAIERVSIKHPLSDSELEVLSAEMARIEVSHDDTAPFDSATQITPSHYTGSDLSQNAIILALFGWEQHSPATKQTSFSSLDLVRNRSSSRLGHARSTSGNGSGRSTPIPQGSTTLERKSSGSVRNVAFADSPQRRLGKGREYEPAPLSAIESTSGDDESITISHEAEPIHSPVRTSTSRREGSGGSGDGQGKDDMIQCVLCQRRIGLWAFISPATSVQPISEPAVSESTTSTPMRVPSSPSPRFLDVLREHRAFCPYVIRTSPLTIPNDEAPSAEVEGWKMIVGIISRSKRRESIGETSTTNPFRESTPGQNGVESAVSRVKRSPGGSRDLLRYVKGLLA